MTPDRKLQWSIIKDRFSCFLRNTQTTHSVLVAYTNYMRNIQNQTSNYLKTDLKNLNF